MPELRKDPDVWPPSPFQTRQLLKVWVRDSAARTPGLCVNDSHPQVRRNARHSLRNGFNGFLRDLPGDRAFLSSSSRGYGWPGPGQADFTSAKLDAGVEASGPHDFAVRKSAVRQCAL
jgi:hypothetical protein